MSNAQDCHQALIRKGVILAAGLGTRMRPLTDILPKPLIEVAGKPLIDHAIGRLIEADLEQIIVNFHYLPHLMRAHLSKDVEGGLVVLSDETEALLETGGGTKKVLPLLGDDPFIVTNSDSLWIEGASHNLVRLKEAFDPQKMDGLLLLAPTTHSIGHHNRGDFIMDSEGVLQRAQGRSISAFTYAGTGILKPSLFKETPKGAFSLNLIFDRLLAENRLYGLRLDGLWLHVGTPEALHLAEEAIAQSKIAS